MSFLRLVLCLGLAVAAWAQADANKGQIVGVVTDPNGAVVPNSAVTVRNLNTGLTRELRTGTDGQFRASYLDPGQYDVTAASGGFAPTTLSGLTVTVGGTAPANMMLRVEQTTTTVDVTDSLLQVALPAPSTTVNNQAIQDLPILGRRFQDFATLTPTVQVDPQRGQLSIVGQRGIYGANVMVDGTDYNQPFFGGIRGGERSNNAFTVPQSSIQEFQVVTTGYSAEYGRSTGGILNAITRSGTNSYRGEAFYQIRHEELGSENPYGIISNERLQQFGGAAGGPFVADRWFWFVAAEQQFSEVPRQVAFTNLPASAPAGAEEAFNFYVSQRGPFTQTNDATVVMGRTDYQFTAGHRLAIRYNHSRNDADNAGSQGGALQPLSNDALSNEALEKDRTHSGVVQYTHLFSPTVINDSRFQYTFELRPREAKSELPSVSASATGGFGARSFLPTTQDDTRIQFVNTTAITAGNHTFKLGLDYNRLKTFQAFGFNQFGQFVVSTSSQATALDVLSVGGGIADRFDSPIVTYNRQIGNLIADFGAHQFAAFVQDSWRAHPTLTLDFGFRWEGQWNPEVDASNTDLVNRVRGFTFPNGATLDPSNIPDAVDQFMPRFGFAWSPTWGRRTVVRGHTGIFYASTPLLVFAGNTNVFRDPPGNLSLALRAIGSNTVYDQLRAVGVDLNQYKLDNLPVIPVETVQRAASQALGTPPDPYAGAQIDVVASDFVNPRSLQAGFGVESELFSNFIAGFQLNYVNTVNMMRNVDYNLPAPIIRPVSVDPAQRPFYGLRSTGQRPIPSLGAFTVRESSARSMYRGVTFQAQYRTLRRLQFSAFYTLSEAFSDSDLERDAGGVDFNDNYDFRRDYNYARLDARHQFTGNALISLPLGLELSAITRIRSGHPLNATTGVDSNEDLFFTDRPYSAPGVPFERNSFRNRRFSATDVRLLKNINFGEVTRLQLSAEFFNAFNQDNVVYNSTAGTGQVTTFGPGLGVPPDPRFQQLRTASGGYNAGTTTQLGTPLQVQFGLRFFF